MNWKDELKENMTTAGELKDFLNLTDEETVQMDKILEQFPMTVTRYYLSLINRDDPKDPIRRMCIPTISENDLSGTFDTSGEESNTIMPGLQHKYAQTAMILSTNRCAMYCRHCFRKRLVGVPNDEILENFDEMADYIEKHSEITNVLISGGDAFLINNSAIRRYLETFSAIDHLDLIRFGTRTPVVFPARIYDDPELLDIIREFSAQKQIYVVTHFNHPNEFTEESKKSNQSTSGRRRSASKPDRSPSGRQRQFRDHGSDLKASDQLGNRSLLYFPVPSCLRSRRTFSGSSDGRLSDC